MRIILQLLQNQNFLRYIKYLGETNPLDNALPNISPNNIINNGKNDGCIYPVPFNENILTENGAILFFNPYEFKKLDEIVSADIYALDIIIPNKYWYIHSIGEWRAYLIIHEIAKSIDNKHIAGLGKTEIVNVSNPYKIENGYSGVTVFIRVYNATTRGY